MQALADAKVSTEEIAAIEVIGGSSRVPALIKILKDFFNKEPSRTLNAKECVSRGCALNCAMLSPIFRCVMPKSWLIEDALLSSFDEFSFGGSLPAELHPALLPLYLGLPGTPAPAAALQQSAFVKQACSGLHAQSCMMSRGLGLQ